MDEQSSGASTQTSPAPVSQVTLDEFDPEGIENKVRSGFERTQLAPGRFTGKLLRANLGESLVDWGHYNLPLMARGQMPGERVILALISDFREPGNLNGHSVSNPTPVLLTEGAALDYRIPPYAQWFTFHLPRQLAETAGMSLAERHAAPLAAEPQQALWAASRINSALTTLRSIALGSPGLPNPAAGLSHLEAELLDVFSAVAADASRTASNATKRPANASKLVSTAMEIIDAHIDQPLSIGKLCQQVGCNWKSLERAFTSVTGLPPKRFLSVARLNRARRMLIRAAADESVTSIAGRCGIQHLGRFSRDYRSLFGELPSETRRVTSGS